MNVPKNALDQRPVNITGRVHMQANLLHHKLNVWSGERKVLKCANNAVVEVGVSSGLAGDGGELRLGLSRSGGRLAVSHAGTVQKIKSVLPLVKKETRGIVSHINAEEEVQRA